MKEGKLIEVTFYKGVFNAVELLPKVLQKTRGFNLQKQPLFSHLKIDTLNLFAIVFHIGIYF